MVQGCGLGLGNDVLLYFSLWIYFIKIVRIDGGCKFATVRTDLTSAAINTQKLTPTAITEPPLSLAKVMSHKFQFYQPNMLNNFHYQSCPVENKTLKYWQVFAFTTKLSNVLFTVLPFRSDFLHFFASSRTTVRCSSMPMPKWDSQLVRQANIKCVPHPKRKYRKIIFNQSSHLPKYKVSHSV